MQFGKVLKLALLAAVIVASRCGSSTSRDCGKPDPIKNGKRKMPKGTMVGGEAIYSCKPGFVLEGPRKRVCKDSGAWSKAPPLCKGDCGKPDPIKNGKRKMPKGTMVGGKAIYSCKPGFVLEGPRKRVCKDSGAWSKAPPLCKATCDSLEDIPNGNVETTGNSPGDNATYSCDETYTMQGQPTRTCQDNGTWSGEEPECKTSCDSLEDIPNGNVETTGNSPEDNATYSCDETYTMQGQPTRTCQDNGTWSGEEPECKRTECYPLFLVFGQVRITGTGVGATAYLTCDRGYSLEAGSSVRFCRSDGTWDGNIAYCRKIRCPFLRADNGRVSQGDRSVGSTASYNCYSGYSLVGPSARVCDDDGSWTSTEPACKKDCVRLPTTFLHGSFSVIGDNFPGTTILFRCGSRYRLNGSPVLVCQRDGTWSGRYPYCTDRCGILRVLGCT